MLDNDAVVKMTGTFTPWPAGNTQVTWVWVVAVSLGQGNPPTVITMSDTPKDVPVRVSRLPPTVGAVVGDRDNNVGAVYENNLKFVLCCDATVTITCLDAPLPTGEVHTMTE